MGNISLHKHFIAKQKAVNPKIKLTVFLKWILHKKTGV